MSQEQIKDVIKEFIRKFKAKYFESIEQTDKLYLEYYFTILKKSLTPKLISAHLFWCQRNYLLKEECKLCSQVIMFYNELPTIYLYSKHYSDLWDKHTEKVFSDEMHFKLETKHERDCTYFENVYHKTQLINLFCVISLRIFLILLKSLFLLHDLNKRKDSISFFLPKAEISLQMHAITFASILQKMC